MPDVHIAASSRWTVMSPLYTDKMGISTGAMGSSKDIFTRKRSPIRPICVLLAVLVLIHTAHTRPIFSTASTSAIRLNQVQLKGTHNSYHREQSLMSRPFFEWLITSPQNYYYSHSSLPVQFSSQSVRSIELDIHADYSSPGQFADPLISRLADLPDPPASWTAEMKKPGAKVMHVPDADVFSSCPTLATCLGQVRAWSAANPGHVPLIIDLEFKGVDDRMVQLGGAPGEEWNASNLAKVDEEIRSVFSADQLITPDDVRLRSESEDSDLTLEESVLKYGWPTLDESRGKVLFIMDNNPVAGSVRDLYRANGHASLEGRVIFTNSNPGEADAAFVKRNDPTGQHLAEIQDLVRRGYLVRTRADEPITTVLTRSTAKRDAAFASGAQIVSTDWPAAGMAARYDSDYVVELPGGGVARCNPVNAPAGCRDAELEGSSSRSSLRREEVRVRLMGQQVG